MKTQMHANVCKKKCLAAITAMLMAALLVVPANVKAVAGCTPLNDADFLADLRLIKDGKEYTGTDAIEVGKDDNMTFVAKLNGKHIKGQINYYERKYIGKQYDIKCDPNTCEEDKDPKVLKDLKAKYAKIKLSEVYSTFKVTLTLGEGLKFANDVETTLTGADDLFEIKETKIEEKEKCQTATITMELKDKAKYTKYGALREDVFGVVDKLGIKLTGVQFADNAEANEPYKVTGTVKGEFYVSGEDDNYESMCFDLSLTGEKVIKVKYAASAPAPAPVEPEVEIPYVPSDPVEPVVTEVVEPKVGKVAKTGEMANTVNQLGLIILAAASVVIAKKH